MEPLAQRAAGWRVTALDSVVVDFSKLLVEKITQDTKNIEARTSQRILILRSSPRMITMLVMRQAFLGKRENKQIRGRWFDSRKCEKSWISYQ